MLQDEMENYDANNWFSQIVQNGLFYTICATFKLLGNYFWGKSSLKLSKILDKF